MKSTAAGQEKGPKPRRVAVRVWLEEEDFQLLKTRASDHERTPGDLARHLLANAIRSFWAYEGRRILRGEEPGIAVARDFLLDLYQRQYEALELFKPRASQRGERHLRPRINASGGSTRRRFGETPGALGRRCSTGSFVLRRRAPRRRCPDLERFTTPDVLPGEHPGRASLFEKEEIQ